MAALAELPELVGFFSYSRRDDERSAGALSALRRRIHDELGLQLGRDLRLWQDTAAIPHGSLWQDEINRAIAESVFFIPIVTPSAVGSEHCKYEFDAFRSRESALGRDNLIFPILYVRVPDLEDRRQREENELLKTIHARQYLNWTALRLRDPSSADVAEKVELFCRNISNALRQQWIAPQQRTDTPRSTPEQARVAVENENRQPRSPETPSAQTTAWRPDASASDRPAVLRHSSLGTVAAAGAFVGFLAYVARAYGASFELGPLVDISSIFYAAGFAALVYAFDRGMSAGKLVGLFLVVYALEVIQRQLAGLTLYSMYPARAAATLCEWLVLAGMQGWLKDRKMIGVAAMTGIIQAGFYLLLFPWLIGAVIGSIGSEGRRLNLEFSIVSIFMFGSTAVMLAYGLERYRPKGA
jgi:hypothetical protein